jgi:hypothetical protein
MPVEIIHEQSSTRPDGGARRPAAPFAGRFPDAMTGHDAEPPGARVTGRAERADAVPAFALRASARQPRPLRDGTLEDIRHNIAQERQRDSVQVGCTTFLAPVSGAEIQLMRSPASAEAN